ncbi:MAG TPA: hypothetical protein VJ934_11655 [Desulfomicrobiaceae bacterium]|nr:hypothetical protein [Desulfomicrobiaceae bacterium]
MGQLAKFKDFIFDWEMTPEDAVALYLEWGNNGYRGGYQNAVKGKGDFSVYFIVDTWPEKPRVILVRRNSDGAEELAELKLPAGMAKKFLSDIGNHKGVYGVSPEIRDWLENQIYN